MRKGKVSVFSDQYSVFRHLYPVKRRSVAGFHVSGLRFQVFLLACAAICLASAVGAASFDEQRGEIQSTLLTQPETTIRSLLQKGIEEGKPALAINDAQKWLRQNQPQDPMTFYTAGRAAELSGDWKAAVSLYQQYVKKADLKSENADEAAYAVYTILIERLKDKSSAYSFSKAEGDRLLVCPRAKQFDKWFLDEAVRRGDVLAVARRLKACIDAGHPQDLLIARYDNYFRWLLGRVGGSSGFKRDTQVSKEMLDAFKGLASSMTFFEELKLRLDWEVSARYYVQQKITEKPADPPIAEAKALLSKYPRYAERVLVGWAGGTKDNHPYNVGETKLYWEEQLDEKLAPVLAAVAQLDPLQRASLILSFTPEAWREYQRVKLNEVKAIKDYLAANRAVDGAKYASPLTKSWEHYQPEEAMEIAPKIAKNRHPHVSLVRAIAAGSTKETVKDGDKTRTEYRRDYDKMLAALRGPERWRFSPDDFNGRMTDRLWHYCGRPGGNEKRDKEIKKSKDLAKQMRAKLVKADAPANQRIAEFRKLWGDYRSAQPKIPDVRNKLKQVLRFTPEVVPELLKDGSTEAQKLLREALHEGMTGPGPMWEELDWRKDLKTTRYDPLMKAYIDRHRGMKEIKKRYPKLCLPYPLEDEFRAHIAGGLKQNKLVPWQVQAWINMQWPEDNAEQIEFMQAMVKSFAWKTMPFEVKFSAREWFKEDGMTPGQVAWIDRADSKLLCRDLLSLTNTADVAATAAALSRAIDGVKQSPVKTHIQGLDKLAAITNAVFTDPKVFNQILEITDNLRSSVRADAFGKRLLNLARKERDPVMMHRTAFYLWYSERDTRNVFRSGAQFTESLLEDSPATALALSRIGINLFTGDRSYGFDWQKSVDRLKAIAGKASMKLGLITIPVAKTHPAYFIYKSQAEWLTGNEDSAWRMIAASWDQLAPNMQRMSVEYLMWVLQRTIYSRNDARMEELIKALRTWAGEEGSPWTKEQKLDLDIAYGDIAIQLGQLNNAHKIFVRTQKNPAYADMTERHKAALRRVKVERLAKRFDDAIETINELEMEKIPELWSATRYARAEVYYDMEEYDDAADDIESILARDPDHAEAKIMQGKVHLKSEKLMEASELDVGSKNAKDALVPGEKLKVTLVDPTLAVSGAGAAIEVVVWAASGDRERFLLRQFGDQKTKFRGEVRTALGKPNKDDDVLQVIGDDEIYYAYSERFRKKMNDMEEKRGGPITVRSDAILMASARKLLSEAEQRVADMEAKMLEIARHTRGTAAVANMAKVQAAREAGEANRTGQDRDAAEAAENAALANQLLRDRVKPGKAVNVRVIDPDASRTAGIDEVAVSVESSSGDSIGRIVLKETGTHSGWFEGSIPTDGAQAMAFAQNTEPGRNPNMVISPETDYPAWRPVPSNARKPEFKIDLNDNVPVGDMTIVAKETGAKLKKFVLQTGMNPKEMTTIAVFPKDIVSLKKPWHPSVTIMTDTYHHQARNDRSVYDLKGIVHHLNQGWMTERYQDGVAANVAGPSAAMTNSIPAKVKWVRHGRHHNAHVIYRFRGYFYEPTDVTRRFKVDLGKWTPPKVHPSVANPAQYMLTIDGRRVCEELEKPPKAGAPFSMEGQLNLRKGPHTLEIWATGWDCRIGFGRSVKVMANLEDPEALSDCPDSFFNPDSFPKGALTHRNSMAKITPSSDGTQFNVKFAPGSRTRLVNLVLVEQEGPVPALNKISLKQPDGKKVLPVEQDYAELNKNDRLEILTGDKVFVRYVDDRFVDKAKEKHERMLHVSFSDADCDFVFFEMRKKFNGQIFVDEPYYERLLRFSHGKPLTLKVSDPDMDMTDKPDAVSVTLESRSGGKKKFTARETEDSSGVFQLQVIPVTGAPANANEFTAAKGEKIYAVYRDEENIRPGVPVDRLSSVMHAVYSPPVLRISHAEVAPIDFKKFAPDSKDHRLRPPGKRGLSIGFASREERLAEQKALRAQSAQGLLRDESRITINSGGLIQPSLLLKYSWADPGTPPKGGIRAVHGREMAFELEAPHLALRSGSKVAVYVQTETGRQQGSLLGGSLDGDFGGSGGFDVTVPGTIKLNAGLAGSSAIGGFAMGSAVPLIPLYVGEGYGGRPGLKTSERLVGEGRSKRIFGCRVPLIADFLPEEGVLPDDEIKRRREGKIPVPSNHALVVKPGDAIYAGVRYEDESGAEKWLTGSAKVITHPALDVMDEDYREQKTTAYAGEELNIRVVDLGADVSDSSDTLKVMMRAKSGALLPFELLEVDNHSGVFRGACELSYVQKNAETNDYSVKRDGFPVVYGDAMAVGYTDKHKQKARTRGLIIHKGADGMVRPFSKKYDDPDIAQRTQFSLAEAYLEMAKRHRKLGETELARDEYARAKDMLEKAMEMFRDPATRAQAEYLLGNLTQEEADATEDTDLQEDRYRAALSRYMRVTGSYPDTLPASKAQFKIATVYESMNEPEIAAQEYVKLAYKYPDSQFLALAMARLGTHFQRKAAAYEKKAKELLAREDDKDAQFDGKAMEGMYVKEYLKSAEIFARLQERFPDHELAGKAGLRAGQAYMRAKANREAVNAFKDVFEHESYDGPLIRAQAMYWAGLCYEALREEMAAYSIYKRLTYDFPESDWASYARAQLSSEKLLNIEIGIEEKRVEAGR